MKIKKVLLVLLIWFVFVGVFQITKKLPEGVNWSSEKICSSDHYADFLYDLTYEDLNENIKSEQMIFDAVFSMVEGAERFIFIDAFLFNPYFRTDDEPYRRLSGELVDILLDKKEKNPEMSVTVVTDPINEVYGGLVNLDLERLRAAGINVIVSDLKRLRDSNPIYSSVWRTFFSWFGNSEREGLFPNPFDRNGPGVSLRSYLGLLNFKANHRKVFLADANGEWTGIVASANPHDASSAHSNVAFRLTGPAAKALFDSEKAMISGQIEDISPRDKNPATSTDETADERICSQIMTEGMIKAKILELINSTSEKDSVKIAQFYLSERRIIKALIKASQRGADIRLVLDPNKDAFGYTKNGIPNLPVAAELKDKSGGEIEIRWYDTHGEQFHTKLFILEKENDLHVLAGSANLTRRNLDNFNLESDVYLQIPASSGLAGEILDYYARIWENKDDNYYTAGYNVYSDHSLIKYLIYRLQEITGLSSF